MTTGRGEFSFARFTWARLLLFAASLLATLIVLQELIALVAHQIPVTPRTLWLVPTKLLLVALMLWLYCGEVHYFERRNVTELAPDGAAWRAAAGIVLGGALFSNVYAALALGGYLVAPRRLRLRPLLQRALAASARQHESDNPPPHDLPAALALLAAMLTKNAQCSGKVSSAEFLAAVRGGTLLSFRQSAGQLLQFVAVKQINALHGIEFRFHRAGVFLIRVFIHQLGQCIVGFNRLSTEFQVGAGGCIGVCFCLRIGIHLPQAAAQSPILQ